MLIWRHILVACLALVAARANGQDDGFNLEDAFSDDEPTPKTQADEFDLSDAFDDDSNLPTEADEFDLSDALDDDSNLPTDDGEGFDLADALSDDHVASRDDNVEFDLNDALRDDATQSRDPDGFDLGAALNDHSVKKTGGDFDDSDLLHVVNGDYKPDKTVSKGQDPAGTSDQISDFLMTLLGGTSEHFQKICFKLMEMLKDLYNTPQEQ